MKKLLIIIAIAFSIAACNKTNDPTPSGARTASPDKLTLLVDSIESTLTPGGHYKLLGNQKYIQIIAVGYSNNNNIDSSITNIVLKCDSQYVHYTYNSQGGYQTNTAISVNAQMLIGHISGYKDDTLEYMKNIYPQSVIQRFIKNNRCKIVHKLYRLCFGKSILLY